MAATGQRRWSLLTVVVALLLVALAAVAPTAGASCEELALVPDCAPQEPEQVGDDVTSTTSASTTSTSTTKRPESQPTSAEATEELLALMNDARADRGAPQARRGRLDEIAADHSAAMAADDDLRHNEAFVQPRH